VKLSTLLPHAPAARARRCCWVEVVEVRCIVRPPQQTATHCNTLQHTATRCICLVEVRCILMPPYCAHEGASDHTAPAMHRYMLRSAVIAADIKTHTNIGLTHNYLSSWPSQPTQEVMKMTTAVIVFIPL